jgi:hypothetical protein
VLVYVYDGTPSLKNAAIPEKSLDFGILDVEGDAPTLPEDHWQFRRLAGTVQDGSYEAALYSPEGLVFSLALRNRSEECRVKDIRITGSQFFTVELFDQRSQSWKIVRGDSRMEVDGVVHESPLGCAYALLRTRAANQTRYNDYSGYGLPALNTLGAVSRIERKPQ